MGSGRGSGKIPVATGRISRGNSGILDEDMTMTSFGMAVQQQQLQLQQQQQSKVMKGTNVRRTNRFVLTVDVMPS